MKKYLFSIILIAFLGACSNDDKDNPGGEGSNAEYTETEYIQNAEQAADLMRLPECADPATLASRVQQLPFVKKVVIDDNNVLHVTADDGSEFTLDPENHFNNLTGANEQLVQPVSPEDIAATDELTGELAHLTTGADKADVANEDTGQEEETPWDGFANIMEIDEPEDTEIVFPDNWDEPDIPTTAKPLVQRKASVAVDSRATAGRVILNRYSMGIWNPWGFNASVITNAIADANAKVVGHKVTTSTIAGTPAGLKSFSNFDLVFMICHGTPDGGLSLPFALWDSYISGYTKKGKDGKKYVDGVAANKDGIYLNFSKVDKEEILQSVVLQTKFLNSTLKSLNRTIVWAAVCHGGKKNSMLRGVLSKKGCPAFVGADDVCTLNGISTSFKPYILKLIFGGNSSLCFHNGTSSVKYSDPKDDKTIASYNLSHTSSACVSYYRSYALGPVRNVIKTADIRVRFIFGTGSSQGPELGILLKNETNGNLYRVPFGNMAKVKTNSRRWDDCAVVYDATLRIRNLTPENNYSYCAYSNDGTRYIYSHTKEYFHTDGFTGYYRFKSLTKYWGQLANMKDEVYEIPRYFMRFTADKFPNDGQEYSWRNWNTQVSGGRISYETWTYPYVGGCGGTRDAHYSGVINEDWDYFKTVTRGWSHWEEKMENCPEGIHHHDMSETIDYYWLQKIPTEYPERQQAPQEVPVLQRPRTIGNQTVSPPLIPIN